MLCQFSIKRCISKIPIMFYSIDALTTPINGIHGFVFLFHVKYGITASPVVMTVAANIIAYEGKPVPCRICDSYLITDKENVLSVY